MVLGDQQTITYRYEACFWWLRTGRGPFVGAQILGRGCTPRPWLAGGGRRRRERAPLKVLLPPPGGACGASRHK
jgi:hypothetical protein